MKHLTWMSALVLAGSLSACGDRDGPATPEKALGDKPTATSEAAADWEASIADLRGLAGEDFSLDGGVEANLDQVNAALPDLVSVSWDEKSFDEASGATVFSGLRVTIASEPEFGMLAEEAEVWGLDTDFIAARLNGERLSETGPALSRLEARNLSYFGVAGAMEALFDSFLDSIEADSDMDIDFDIGMFESNTAEMVISNLTLRPFELSPVSDTFFADLGADVEGADEEEQAQMAMALDGIRLAQHVIAVVRSLEIEESAWYDTDVKMEMTQSPGMTTTVDIKWAFYGYEGVSGFDVDRTVVVDAQQGQSMEMTEIEPEMAEAGFEEGFGYDQFETTAFMSSEGIKLDKLAGFLAMGEFPMMEERDLLSLGTWTARDYRMQLNDNDVFEVGRVFVDAEDFAWLFPTDMSVTLEDAGVGVEALGGFIIDFMPTDATDAESEAFIANFRQAVDKLDEHGLADIPFDFTGKWTWAASSGEAGMSVTSTSEGFGNGLAEVEGNLPDYAGIQAALEADNINEEMERLFEDSLALRRVRLFESDTGGYDKLFGYASDIGKLYPEEGWGAMIGNMDAPQMRNFIATMIRSGKSAAAQEMPPAAEWLEAVAAYYQTPGGSLDIRVEPAGPVTADSFSSDAPPAQIVEELGISVTHTPE